MPRGNQPSAGPMPLALPLPRLNGGINRFDRDAGPDELVDALDVIDDDGEVRRRDAFASVAIAPPHLLPAGSLVVRFGTPNQSAPFTAASTDGRVKTNHVSYAQFYFGGDFVFDGVDFQGTTVVVSPSTPLAQQLRAVGYFWNGSAWTALPFMFDSTILFESGANFAASFMRDGQIAWHRSHVATWAQSTIDSVTKYWIRVLLIRTDTSAQTAIGTGEIRWFAPGPRPFVLEPCNGIFPAKLAGEERRFIIGADARKTTSSMAQRKGAALGDWRGAYRERTRDMGLLVDEGAGVFGEVTWPDWQERTADPDTWANVGGSPGTIGTANQLTKLRRDYDWSTNQFFGGKIRTNLTPSGTGNTTTNLRLASAPSGIANTSLRGLRVRCTARSGAGPAVNEVREIVTNVGADLTVYGAFTAAADANNRFDIEWPGAELFVNQDDRSFEANTNTADALAFLDIDGSLSRSLTDLPAASSATYWRIGRSLRNSIDSGERWSGMRDGVTRHLLLTNGYSPILTFDGRALRQLEANTTSDLALYYVGSLPDDASKGGGADPQVLALSKLRSKPPTGKYLLDFSGRVVVSGSHGRPHDVYWSAPGAANNIWPLLYNATIRDSINSPITGIATLYDRLIAFTATSIHQGSQPDDAGVIRFKPVCQGIGFSTHFAVGRVALAGQQALIGPNADGLYLFSGAEPTPLIKDWAQVLEGGVNAELLHRAVAAVAAQRQWYLCALAPAGAGANTRILVYDYDRKRSWVWSAPFGGVSSIAVDYDAAGRERILIGTDDGFVMTMLNAATDDGDSISAYAKSSAQAPLGFGQEMALTRMLLTMKSLGATRTLDVALYTNKSGSAWQDADLTIDRGESLFGTATFPTPPVADPAPAGTAAFADEGYKTVPLNCPAGTRAHQFQVKIGGTARWRYRSGEIAMRPLSRRGR